MSGFQTMPRAELAMPRPYRPRKLGIDGLSLILREARKHAELLSYDEITRITGLKRGTVRVTMARMIREQRVVLDQQQKECSTISDGSQELVENP